MCWCCSLCAALVMFRNLPFALECTILRGKLQILPVQKVAKLSAKAIKKKSGGKAAAEEDG